MLPAASTGPGQSAEKCCTSVPTRHGAIQLERRTAVMGILNVTPDSFYDGGRRTDAQTPVADAMAMVEAGADIIDIGGESTRPGASPISLHEELARVLPVIRNLRPVIPVPISIDTYKAEVARAVLAEGADMVNDISALTFDAGMADLVAAEKVPVVLMHMQGTPRTMQLDPHYSDVVAEVRNFLARRVEFAVQRASSGRKSSLIQGLALVRRWNTIWHCSKVCRGLRTWGSRCWLEYRARDLLVNCSTPFPTNGWKAVLSRPSLLSWRVLILSVPTM